MVIDFGTSNWGTVLIVYSTELRNNRLYSTRLWSFDAHVSMLFIETKRSNDCVQLCVIVYYDSIFDVYDMHMILYYGTKCTRLTNFFFSFGRVNS